jgi:hypothetical protein
VGAYELQNLLFGLRGMILRMFSRMGWTTEEIEVFLVDVRKALKNMSYHTYYELYASLPSFNDYVMDLELKMVLIIRSIVVYGKKPGETGSGAGA